MRRFFLLILLAISTSTVLNAQNIVYDENAEIRRVEPFNNIEVSVAVTIYLYQLPEQGVAIIAGEEKYNKKIKT